MHIFTLEFLGRPTVALAAQDYPAALAFVSGSFFRRELASLRTPDGKPLRPIGADIMIRRANSAESAFWEYCLEEDIDQGVHEDLEDAIESNGFAFLVEYRDPGE